MDSSNSRNEPHDLAAQKQNHMNPTTAAAADQQDSAAATQPPAAVQNTSSAGQQQQSQQPAAAQSTQAASGKRIRVKVFLRDSNEDEWNEQGTGYLFTGVEENESLDGPAVDEQKCLHVVSENEGNSLC